MLLNHIFLARTGEVCSFRDHVDSCVFDTAGLGLGGLADTFELNTASPATSLLGSATTSARNRAVAHAPQLSAEVPRNSAAASPASPAPPKLREGWPLHSSDSSPEELLNRRPSATPDAPHGERPQPWAPNFARRRTPPSRGSTQRSYMTVELVEQRPPSAELNRTKAHMNAFAAWTKM